MKTIEKDDLYKNLSAFLKEKGVELTDGAIATRVRQGCNILAHTINFAQANLEKAKTQVDTKMDQVRKIIHEKTAPKPPAREKTAGAPNPGKKQTEGENTRAKKKVKAKQVRRNPKAASKKS